MYLLLLDLLKSQRNVFRLFGNTYIWDLPGLGSDGAESGVNGEACKQDSSTYIVYYAEIFENTTSRGNIK